MTTSQETLDVAVAEVRKGLADGGIPIGDALFGADGLAVTLVDSMRAEFIAAKPDLCAEDVGE
jgi:hypothetical protein